MDYTINRCWQKKFLYYKTKYGKIWIKKEENYFENENYIAHILKVLNWFYI